MQKVGKRFTRTAAHCETRDVRARSQGARMSRAPGKRRSRRLLHMLVGTVAALGLVVGTAPAASGASAPQSSAGVRGIGFGVTPRITTAMYSGPGLSTPRIGTAW